MKVTLLEFMLLGVFAFVVTSLLTPVMGRFALKHGVVDIPNYAHKTHSKPVPYLGGISIALGITIVILVSSLMSQSRGRVLALALSMLIPALILGAVGLWDDLKSLSPLPRFIVQSVFGLTISLFLVRTETLGSPFGVYVIDVAVSVIWIVGITNAINFFDNIDGGASGSVAISSIFLFLLASTSNQFFLAALAIVVTGATFGFLIWNRPPARIYMGDAGSLFLGILISTLTLRLDPLPIDRFASFSIPFFILAVPILDTTTAVLSRIRRGISPFQGGRDHLSHRLMRIGYTKRISLLILWFMSTAFCIFALVISFAPNSVERVLAFIFFMIWVVLLILFLRTADESRVKR